MPVPPRQARPRERDGALRSIGMTTPDTRIMLRVYPVGAVKDVIVEHAGQPADYVHTDGSVWTWRERWLPVGGVPGPRGLGRVGSVHLRVYDLVTPRHGFRLTP